MHQPLNTQHPTLNTLSGFYLVHKPVGPSSAAIVARLKWLLAKSGIPKKGPGRIVIGHGGTLDPLADGLLPIGLGKATKQLQALLEGPKTYTFTLTFGTSTTTDDAEGEILQTSDVRPTETDLLNILPTFTGVITQTPPSFSALKVNGQRAYKLARAGEDVILQPREVTIHSLRLLESTPRDTQNAKRETALLEAQVSKGTYIRTLAKNLAEALGTVGHVTTLTRTAHGPFQLKDAISLETLDKALSTGDTHTYLLPLAVPPEQVSPIKG